MNDVQFVEAARKFAERVMLEGGADVESRVLFAFRTVTSRRPSPSESASLRGLFKEYYSEFQANQEAATRLLSAGESPRNESLAVSELGAWTLVTHLLLNLSETITKE